MKKILCILAIMISVVTTIYGATATLSDSNTGYDSDPVVSSVTFSGLPEGATITNTEITTSMGSHIGGWYDMDLQIGESTYNDVGNLDNASYSDLNGESPNGQTITITSKDLDAYADYITLSLDVTITYSVAGAPGVPTTPDPSDDETGVSVTADLSWTNGADTDNVDVYFSTTQSDVTNKEATARVVTSQNVQTYDPGTMSNGTVYFWRVVAKNSNKSETDGPVWSFTTECGVVTTFPWTEGFENGIIPICWSNPGDLWSIGSEAHSGSYCAKATYNHSGEAILVSPAINLPSNYRISFWWKDDDISDVVDHDTTYFEISTDGGTNWTILDYLSSASSMGSYEESVCNLSAYAGDGVYVRWRDVTDASYSAYGVGLDDIEINENPSCFPPSDLAETDIGMTSVALGWTENNTPAATTWDIELGLTGFTPTGTPTADGVTANPYTYTGLSPDTEYDWYVRTDCGSKETSTWTGPSTFTTADGKAENPDPADNAVDVAITATVLDWDDVIGADSYTIDIGTTSGGSDIVDDGVCATSTYTHSAGWDYHKEYFWTVTTVYTAKAAVVGDEWSFNTEYPPDYLFESFEGTFPPSGWQVQNVVGNDWEQYATSSPDGSHSARLYYTSSTGAQSRLVTPKLDITSANNYIDFYCKYYSTGTLKVQYSSDASSWTDLETVSMTTNFAQYNVDLNSLSTKGEYYIGFLGETGTGYSYMYLDAIHYPPLALVPPGVPSSPTPSDDATNISIGQDLIWSNGFGTATVDVYFGTDETLVTNKDASVKVVDNADVQTYDTGTMSNDTEYFWRVVCKNAAKAETDGSVWSFTTAPEGLIQIGDGTIINQYLPIAPYFGYDYNQTIYLSSDFSGIDADQRIEKLYYNYTKASTANTNEDDWQIWIGTTANTNLDAAYIDVSTLTEVFNGSVGFGALAAGVGWLEITLTTPFNYDPSSDGNLVIAVYEYHSSYTSGSDDFYCEQDAKANISRCFHNDSTNPDPSSPPAGTASAYYPNTRFQFDDIPSNPVFTFSPESKDFGTLDINQSSNAQTFTITNNGGGTLTVTSVGLTGDNADQFDLTDGNSYPHDLGNGESITVDVEFSPTTAGSKSADLTVEASAKVTHDAALSGTGYDPYIKSFPYTQGFDGVTAPDLPEDWNYLNDTGNTNATVITSTSYYMSPANSARMYNSSAASGNLMLISPPTALSITDTRVKFWCRTSSGNQNLVVGTMSDPTDAATFTELESIAVDGTFTKYTVNITSKAKADTYISFKHSMESTYDYFYIDEFTWEEIPTEPVFSINPVLKDFGIVNVNESSADQTFTITNTGGGTLTITSVGLTGDDADQFDFTDGNSYPHDLGMDESITVDVAFSPTSVGSKSADLSIESNAKVTHTAALTGEGWNVNHGGGGAAQGGYYFANSTNGAHGAPSQPSYGWIDISATGTDVSGTVNDDSSVGGPYDIGFTFNYFGTDYTQFYICADGYISLIEEITSDYTNDPIPDTADPNGMIALLWDDMDPAESAVTGYHLYYGSHGGKLVITYEKMPQYDADENGWFTAQVILYPGGRIKLQYKEVGSSFDLTSCTVGIENAAGDAGVQYLYNGTGGDIYAGTKEGEIAIEFGKDEGSLPVILSAFTAQYLNNIPTIYWETESETDNLGWFVYRNKENDFTTAEKISDFIEGHGTTTQQQSYVFEDTIEDPETGDAYYYWLESVDLGGMVIHYNENTMLVVPAIEEPSVTFDIPIKIGLYQNFPNPFNPNLLKAKIYFYLGDGASSHVEIKIYNIKGELVKTVWNQHTQFSELPIHTTWDGRDNNGKVQANGVYFYKMIVDGKDAYIKKLLIVD